jgi:hypothetical protein
MFEILAIIALTCMVGFLAFVYLKARAEAKDEGLVSDEYIENNEEYQGERRR